MTTRQLMSVVAVVAVSLGGIAGSQRLRQRRDEFADRAQWHREIVAAWNAKWRPAPSGGYPLQLVSYHAAMARKYRHAACYPWLPVEPDPPEPE
jgi:hypothetical protein